MAIELRKSGEKINLSKSNNISLGQIVVNLNWNQSIVEKKGFFSSLFGGNKSIDLDLGCLYELKDGTKGAVQALGNAFGSLSREPYVQLDNDDRTGTSIGGENLTINGNEISQIKRILLYTFIYEGVPNWSATDGVVTIKQQNGENIIIRMDEHRNNKIMCALGMIRNVNDETFSIERLVKYYPGHKEMDRAYNWNMNWTSGRK